MNASSLLGLWSSIAFALALASRGAADDKPPAKQTEFRQDLKRSVAWVHGKQFLLGHLDAKGNFLPDPIMTRYVVGQPWGGSRWFDYLNLSRGPKETVYEFRSGLLVKGTLYPDGKFVPETRATIIKFSEYRFGPDSPRIFNLPGRFVERDAGKPK